MSQQCLVKGVTVPSEKEAVPGDGKIIMPLNGSKVELYFTKNVKVLPAMFNKPNARPTITSQITTKLLSTLNKGLSTEHY